MYITLIISNLVGDKQSVKLSLMHNFIANFVKVLGIIKEFAGNCVNVLGNIPRRVVVPYVLHFFLTVSSTKRVRVVAME